MLTVDPNTTFKVVLECHKGMETEPCFLFRHLSARRYKELSREYDSLNLKMGSEEAMALTNKLATTNMIDWCDQVNLDTGEKIGFDIASIDIVCGAKELWELITKVLSTQRVGAEDKKKLGLQWDSSMEESAKIAEEPPDVEKSPQNTA